ncbi:MAG TPA: ABC transporter ATP-binding protein [Synergistaceae bacterium]|nr:ABC transporter ATP-binding protein [Synergistaceae bacterium]HQF91575.1 ABC transporter ATP-binding protein [Synergistaceae bacterium]HQH78539.1 ABC transporter ATP-binding protein [Synergistaceae bacterium]HQK26021.1 ABC transporter ATP-binding protein [Synergistaceae bacterium]
MIRIENVTKRFGAREAVRGVSLHLPRGTLCGLVGPDGAGKTTLLRMVAGVLAPTAGSITVGGARGYMPQRFSLYEDCTVEENMTLFGTLQGLRGKDLPQRSQELLRRYDLLPFRDRLAGRLSGGMKQKLALSAALLSEPEVLILDEPGTGVDPLSRREIWRALHGMHREGRTIVVATPSMDEAQLCSFLVFLSRGRVRERGTPGEICAAYPWTVLRVVGPERRDLREVLAACPCEECHAFGAAWHLAVRDEESARRALEEALARFGIEGYEISRVPPSLEDVFVFREEE